MKYPNLVPSSVCNTPAFITLYGEGFNADGSKIKNFEIALKCNFNDKETTVLTAKKELIRITGKAYFSGDIFSSIKNVNGHILINDKYYDIYSVSRCRNPDGSVNYTLVELK